MAGNSHGGHNHNTSPGGPPDAEWRKMSDRVRNWGRWGADDELGTLNHITPEALAYAATLVKKGKSISCGVPINAHGPQGAHGIRRNPIHVMTVTGSDAGRPGIDSKSLQHVARRSLLHATSIVNCQAQATHR